MFPFRWLRTLVRKNTSPIPKDVATDWRGRLSKAYAFIGLNIAGIILYLSYTNDLNITMNKSDQKALSQAQKFAYLGKGKDMDVIEVRGFRVTKHYTHEPNSQEGDEKLNVM